LLEVVSGAVQGVGFRPFVYNIAQQLGVVGEVYNDSAGVVIFVQCTHTQFKQFLFRLKSNTPALATITKIKTKDCQIEKYLDFSIAQSRSGEVATRVLPDASSTAPETTIFFANNITYADFIFSWYWIFYQIFWEFFYLD
jgi:hydrogenase maturation protein HypF